MDDAISKLARAWKADPTNVEARLAYQRGLQRSGSSWEEAVFGHEVERSDDGSDRIRDCVYALRGDGLLAQASANERKLRLRDAGERNGWWFELDLPEDVHALAWSPDGRTLVGLEASRLLRWSLTPQEGECPWGLEFLDGWELSVPGEASRPLRLARGVVAASPDGRWVAYAHQAAVVLEPTDGGRSRTWDALEGVVALRFADDALGVVGASGVFRVVLTDPEPEGLLRLDLDRLGDAITAAAWAPDGSTLAVGTRSGAVAVFER